MLLPRCGVRKPAVGTAKIFGRPYATCHPSNMRSSEASFKAVSLLQLNIGFLAVIIKVCCSNFLCTNRYGRVKCGAASSVPRLWKNVICRVPRVCRQPLDNAVVQILERMRQQLRDTIGRFICCPESRRPGTRLSTFLETSTPSAIHFRDMPSKLTSSAWRSTPVFWKTDFR
jgi:hypothetical protein